MTEPQGKAQVTNAQARKTALLVAVVLLVCAAWNYHRGRTMAVEVLGVVAVALLFMGLFVPPLARGFHLAWMRFARALGYVNSRVLLTLLFYGFFVPYGLVSRLVGRDPLHRRAPNRDSYWMPRKTTRQTRAQFERLF